MVRKCDVYNCEYKKGEFPLFKLPHIKEKVNPRNHLLLKRQREAWLFALKIRKATKIIHVCGQHFVKGKPASYKEVNDCDWVPTLNMGYKKPFFVPNVELKLRINKKHKTENSRVNINMPGNKELRLSNESFDSAQFMADSNSRNITSTSVTADSARIHDMCLITDSSPDNTTYSVEDEVQTDITDGSGIYDTCLITDNSPDKTTCSVEIQTDITSQYITALEADRIKKNVEIHNLSDHEIEDSSCGQKLLLRIIQLK